MTEVCEGFSSVSITMVLTRVGTATMDGAQSEHEAEPQEQFFDVAVSQEQRLIGQRAQMLPQDLPEQAMRNTVSQINALEAADIVCDKSAPPITDLSKTPAPMEPKAIPIRSDASIGNICTIKSRPPTMNSPGRMYAHIVPKGVKTPKFSLTSVENALTGTNERPSAVGAKKL